MKRTAGFLLWLLLALVLMVGIDQLLLRVEPRFAAWTSIHTFYSDFRSRLLHLVQNRQVAPTVKPRGPVNKEPAGKPAKPVKPEQAVKAAKPTLSPADASPRYLYVDDKGELHFADSLDEIPASLRSHAQPLER